MGKFVLGAYWGPRAESLEQCANRLSRFLEALAAFDPLLTRWYPKRAPRKGSPRNSIDSKNHSLLHEILDMSRNRENADRSVMEDLGFQLGLWNGEKVKNLVELSIRCGLSWTSSAAHVSIGNSVILDLPEGLPALDEPNRVSELLSSTADTWKPDWAGVMSETSMIKRGFDAERPFVDWMLFLPRKIGNLPSPSSVLDLPSGGSIIVVHPTPPDACNAESLALIDRVSAVIDIGEALRIRI